MFETVDVFGRKSKRKLGEAEEVAMNALKGLIGFVWLNACFFAVWMGLTVVGEGDPYVIAAFVTPILPWALFRLYRWVEDAEDEKSMGTWRQKRVLRLELERHGASPSRAALSRHHRAWVGAHETTGMSIAEYVAGLAMPPEARLVSARAGKYTVVSWTYPDPSPRPTGGVVMALSHDDMEEAQQVAREHVRELGGKPWF